MGGGGDASASFLVVDDDENVARCLARELRAFGHAERADSVEHARRAMTAQPFDGLLVDVALPDGSGLDLVAGVRASDRRTPVLIMSGHVDERRLVTAHRLRAAYLLKPLDLEEIRRFALAVRDELALRRSKIDAAVQRWKQDYGLTAAEATVVLLGARGVQRFALAAHRGVAESTIKTQVERLLAKTGDDTFEAAANRLLREVIGET